MLHVNISSCSSSRELNASDSVITGRVMLVNRAVTYSTSHTHLQTILTLPPISTPCHKISRLFNLL